MSEVNPIDKNQPNYNVVRKICLSYEVYSSQLLICISSMGRLQKEMINAVASLVFVIKGMLKSTAARRIL